MQCVNTRDKQFPVGSTTHFRIRLRPIYTWYILTQPEVQAAVIVIVERIDIVNTETREGEVSGAELVKTSLLIVDLGGFAPVPSGAVVQVDVAGANVSVEPVPRMGWSRVASVVLMV